ncbi:25767_t:CDS:2, partial [Gigaspora rosea]
STVDEDPTEWLSTFEKATQANNWTKERRQKIAAGYLQVERKNKWHYELNNIKQGKNEGTADYVIRFKRLLKKVDPPKRLPDDYQVHLFLSGLKEDVAMFTTMRNLTSLDDSINIAKEVAASKYYSKNKDNKETSAERNINNKVDTLTKQMQQLFLNYATLTSVLSAQRDETYNPKPQRRDRNNDVEVNNYGSDIPDKEYEIYINEDVRHKPYNTD